MHINTPEKNKMAFLLFLLILITQIGGMTFFFVTQKEGLFSDEIFSYALSSSYYHPYFGLATDFQAVQDFAITSDENGSLRINFAEAGYSDCYEWISGTAYHNYLTVQPDQRFAYDSILYNERSDVHPPLYYMILHTICSLFPDTFSIWYAYILNILFFVITQIFLFFTTRRITHSSFTALLGCLLYGGSAAGFTTTLFLRPYCFETMLWVVFTFWAVEIYYRYPALLKNSRQALLCAAVTSFLAFMTHLSSILYIGVFTACYCLLLLLHREWKKMLVFGLTILSSFLLFIMLWSSALFQLAFYNEGNSTRFSPSLQLKMLLRLLCQYCFGFSISVLKTPLGKILLPLLAVLCILVPLFLFPFRREAWLQNRITQIIHLPGRCKRNLSRADLITVVLFLSAISIYITSCFMSDVYHMGGYIIRYIMPSFPILCMTGVIWLRYILSRSPLSGNLSGGLAVVLICTALVRSHQITECPFLMPHYNETQNTAELLRDKNVVVVADSLSSLQQYAVWTVPYLINTKNVFLVSADFLPYYLNDIEQLDESIDYVLISYRTLLPDDSNQAFAYDMLADYAHSSYVFNSSLAVWGISSDSFGEQATVSEQTPDFPVDIDCSPYIQSLNGGCSYRIICGVNAQTQLLYVLALQ